MTKLNFLQRATIVFGLLLTALPAAQAQAPKKQMNSYADMCVNAAGMPKPFGEWDLKGNAKLPEYCKCFSEAFEVRARKAMAEMQAGAKPPSLEQSNKEELELRNVCRKKTGLPLAVEPK
jgi:hypothetical protein